MIAYGSGCKRNGVHDPLWTQSYSFCSFCGVVLEKRKIR